MKLRSKSPLAATIVLAVAAFGSLVALAGEGEEPKGHPRPEAYKLKGKLVQTAKEFDNPEGAIFSADGRYVFISNAAITAPDKGFHWTEKQGYVSKLEVQQDGTLKMAEPKLVTGLTAPLGMAVLPVATKTFPKGSIFLCAGGLPLADRDGNEVKDPKRLDSKMVVFSPEGKVLGEIPWNADSELAKVTGAPATLPNAAGFDRRGNLYIADTGIAGDSVEPKLDPKPGLVMIPHGALDDLAGGKAPGEGVRFVAMPGGPDGLEVSPVDGTVGTNTVGVAAGMNDTDKGGMFKLSMQDFVNGRLPKAFSGGWGALDGLDFTASGTRLDTQILPPNYLTVVPKGGTQVYSLEIQGLDRDLNGPADIAIHARSDGSLLLVIPELSANQPNTGQDPVDVVLLPKGF